jgi:hypothetical protein
MLPNYTRETPWWAWVVAVAIIVASVLVLPDDAAYHALTLGVEH